jgi:hypothetical protein
MKNSLARQAVALAFAAWLPANPATSYAQSTPVDQPSENPAASLPAPPMSPGQIERIRRALNQEPGLKIDERQLRFYLEVVARRPTFADYAKGYDFINGPTKGGNPMSHQEFLQMVTPKEFYSTAGITPLDQIQLAFTNYVGQALIRKALDELKQAKSEREVQAIRERIDRELDALTNVRDRSR